MYTDSRWGTCGLVTKTSIKWNGDATVHTMCLILNDHVIAKKDQRQRKRSPYSRKRERFRLRARREEVERAGLREVVEVVQGGTRVEGDRRRGRDLSGERGGRTGKGRDSSGGHEEGQVGEVEGCKEKMIEEEKGMRESDAVQRKVSKSVQCSVSLQKKACLQTGLWVLLYWLHKAGKSKLFFSPVYCRD